MTEHRRCARTKLLLEVEDSIQRFTNLLRLPISSRRHKLLQRFA